MATCMNGASPLFNNVYTGNALVAMDHLQSAICLLTVESAEQCAAVCSVCLSFISRPLGSKPDYRTISGENIERHGANPWHVHGGMDGVKCPIGITAVSTDLID